MRLTVLDGDPGEKIKVGIDKYIVYLDGVEIKHVFTADDEKGEVISAVFDERGYVTVENGEVKQQTLHGKVCIKPI
ncbi:hypothetical protein [Citrobacter portucalensis]|uniref:hypothetical protein n=1 Tax=Citrobacter portucalensis TaxID=1639133 RepID=UPI002549DCD1|nr:hypothetical protein [Citrobacter portucalensis]HBK4928792.1 hypothetical protein [Citrobacter freundii]